jgi:hypothetical protein
MRRVRPQGAYRRKIVLTRYRRLFIGFHNLGVDLLAIDLGLGWRVNPQLHLIAFEGDDRNGDAIINRNTFAHSPGQNQHSTLHGEYAVWCADSR